MNKDINVTYSHLHLAVFMLIFTAYPCFSAPPIPSAGVEQINPGRTGEQLAPSEVPPTTPQPNPIESKIETPIKVKGKSHTAFILKKIEFIGDKIFTDNELYSEYSNFIDKKVTMSDIQNICYKLTRFYRNNGYILTRVIVPPQEIDSDGILILQIVDGHIDNVKIEGDLRDATYKLLKGYGEQLSTLRKVTINKLERYTLLANDIPGAKVKAIIKPSKDNSGAAELTFIANQKKNDWYVGANNFSSEILGRGQATGGINANGYFSGSQTGLRTVLGFYITRLKYFALSHKQQLNTDGLGFDALISDTITNPVLTSLGLYGYQTPGQAFILTANLNYPYLRSRRENLYFSLGFNYLNSHTSYLGTKLFKDAIRSFSAKFSYNRYSNDQSINSVEGKIYQGFNILGAEASPPSIPGGNILFSKATLSISRYQALPKNFYLLIWATGQYGFNQLLSSEKFGFGGSPFGYGYDPSTITGDRGYAIKIEPQYNYSINQPYLDRIQYFAFFDNGGVTNINTQILVSHQYASSIGAGARGTIYKRLYTELIIAKPFNTFNTNNNKNNFRILFNLNYTGGLIFG